MGEALLDRKFEHWQNQLLDLGRRNKMINYRETKRATLKLIEPEFEELFRRVAIEEEELTFQSPIDKNSDIRTYSVLALLESLSCPIPVNIGDIKAEGSILERQKTLKQLRSKARLALDEQGTNILYMVSGFVEWREKNDASSSWTKSPLILVPVSLILDSLNAPYILKKYEDDIVVNPTLTYLFERDYGIVLPSFDPDEQTISEFMDMMEELVDKKGWRIVRENSIGLVSFLKISMYKDLCNNEDDVKENPIIRAFAGDTSALNEIPEELYNYKHDKVSAPNIYQVVNADSSQQDAILLSQKGISFVMQGPPGTGKSQTITNIISQGLADGKRILFVSEKAAALEVVYKRLKEVHLDDFCLALHSYKANKKEVLEELGKSLELKPIKVKYEEIAKLTELDMLKEFLQAYVSDIHKEKLPLEMSLYEVFGELASLEDAIELPFELDNVDEMTKDQVNRLGLLVMDFDKSKAVLGDTWYKNPWNGTVITNVSHELNNQIKEKFSVVLYHLQEVIRDFEKIQAISGEEIVLSLGKLEDYLQLVNLLMDCSDIPNIWVGGSCALDDAKSMAISLEKRKTEITEYEKELQTIFTPDFMKISAKEKLSKMQQLMEEIEKDLGIDRSSWRGFVENTKNEAAHLNEHYVAFDKMLKEIGTLSENLKIKFPNTRKELQERYRVAHILNQKYTVSKNWFESSTDETLRAIEDYEKVCTILANKEKLILERCDLAITEAEHSVEIEKIKELPDDKLGTVKKFTFEELKKKVNSDTENCNEIKRIYDELHGEVEEKIGSLFELPECFSEIEKGISVIKFLVRNTMPGETWYEMDDTGKFDDYICLCADRQEKYNRLRKEIDEAWSQEIYQLDYNAYLARFKTEYKGIFKVFKKSYRDDMKVLKALYHPTDGTTLKNINIIIAALEKLSEIADLRMWFDDNEALLKNCLGGKFCGVATQLAEIREDRTTFRNCYSLNGVGSKLLLYIEKYDHHEKNYYLLAAELLEKLAHVIENSESKNLYEKQTFLDGMSEQKECIGRMTTILNTYESMKYLLVNEEQITVDDFLNLLGNVSEYRDMQIQKTVIEDRLKELLGENSVINFEDLLEIKKGIRAVEELKCIWEAVPERIQEIMLSQSVIEKLVYTEETVDNTVDELCEKLYISDNSNVICSELQEKVENLLYYCDELQSENEEILSCRILETKDVDVKDSLEKLNMTQQYRKEMNEKSNKYTEKYGKLYLGEHTDWHNVLSIIEKTISLNALIEKLHWSNEQVKKLLQDNGKTVHLKQVENDIEKLRECESIYQWICSLFDETLDFMNQGLQKIYVRWSSCLEQLSTLDAWIDFRECRRKCCDNGLEKFIVGAEDAYYPAGTLINSFMKMFYLKWAEKICVGTDAVAQFRSRIQESKIARFCELDTHQLPVAQMRIREKLIAEMPDRNNFNRATDEMGILLHELNKKRKIMPLRKLFRTVPNLLLKLKPCIMMSPLSVSYFLEAETYKFDMVIFDEASQIFPQDAIGAICRGKQVIIAGDSKQLPPTSFFASSTSNMDGEYDSEEDEDEVIYDSILEEAANRLPNRSLLWHYRSRNEDLIAFSNQEIYRNKLITFPSSNTVAADSGVEYIYVENGVYSGRCNIEEAKKCVEIIKEHIVKHPERSLGIIAFSEKQQTTIEEEVQRFREKNPMYERFFAEDKEEPFFVKNLENVQGDERDTIIFSICYARDANGRMFMRFGPLGHQGGERRLNVAITRAKYNVKLVGSIMPYDIDLDKTKSDGVRMLRSYIEFAIKGNETLHPHKNSHALYDTDEFCNYICRFLQEKGYRIKQYVGNSDYKIDIAVEHPNYPGCFVAGIECDGNSYLMARSTRDREHLRRTVLEQMGWKMFHLWSAEWTNNRESEQQRLLDFINNAVETYKKSEDKKEKTLLTPSEAVQVETIQKKAEPKAKIMFLYYQEGDWRRAEYDPRRGNLENLAARVRVVVEAEQPIHLDVLYRRLASAFGNEKATKPVKNTINICLERTMKNEIVIEDNFVRLSNFTDIKARIPRGIQDRSIEYISKPEIADAMRTVIKASYGISKDDLCTEVTSIFGYDRMGPKISKAMNDTISYMLEKNMVTIVDGKMHLKEG